LTTEGSATARFAIEDDVTERDSLDAVAPLPAAKAVPRPHYVAAEPEGSVTGRRAPSRNIPEHSGSRDLQALSLAQMLVGKAFPSGQNFDPV
jgi:hypothetical protein